MKNTERQSHGFDFEEAVIKKYNIEASGAYTSEWDGFLNGKPVSIKVAKNGTDIEMADYFRNANKTEDFYLIVGFWEGLKNNIVAEHVLFISHEEWISMMPVEFAKKFKDLLAGITNNHEDDARWKEEIKVLKKEWKNKTNNLIRPRFKRDHKKQKRIQCAINNKDFHSHFVKLYTVEV